MPFLSPNQQRQSTEGNFSHIVAFIGASVWSKILRPTRHKIGHFGDVLPSQSLGSVPKKTKTQQN